MSIKNINKPTSPFWGKVIVACSLISGCIAAYGKWEGIPWIMNVGGVLGIIGTVLPVILSSGKKE